MRYSEGERSTRRVVEDDKSKGKTEGITEYGNTRSLVVRGKRLMNWSLGTTMFRIRCKRTAWYKVSRRTHYSRLQHTIMISPNTYQDIKKLHGPGKGVPDTGGGGDCDNKNSSECKSWKANKFSELRLHLSSVPSLRMRPSKWTGKVNNVTEAWITLDFAALNTSPVAPVALANIVVKRG
jgi:hypothetical protein